MRVLFLDIDGVCNSEASFANSREVFLIDPKMAFLVRRIVRETGCKIVLSSSWRHSEEGVRQVEERVGELLDRTMRSFSGYRGHEVRCWLGQHRDVEKYAILDDTGDFYYDQPLFQTDWKVGLTPEIADAVIAHLNE